MEENISFGQLQDCPKLRIARARECLRADVQMRIRDEKIRFVHFVVHHVTTPQSSDRQSRRFLTILSQFRLGCSVSVFCFRREKKKAAEAATGTPSSLFKVVLRSGRLSSGEREKNEAPRGENAHVRFTAHVADSHRLLYTLLYTLVPLHPCRPAIRSYGVSRLTRKSPYLRYTVLLRRQEATRLPRGSPAPENSPSDLERQLYGALHHQIRKFPRKGTRAPSSTPHPFTNPGSNIA